MTAPMHDAHLYALTEDGWHPLGGMKTWSFDFDLGEFSRDAYRILMGMPPLCCARYDRGDQCDRPATSTVWAAGRDWRYCGEHGRFMADRLAAVEAIGAGLGLAWIPGKIVDAAWMEGARAVRAPFADLPHHPDCGLDLGIVRGDDFFRRNRLTVFAEQHGGRIAEIDLPEPYPNYPCSIDLIKPDDGFDHPGDDPPAWQPGDFSRWWTPDDPSPPTIVTIELGMNDLRITGPPLTGWRKRWYAIRWACWDRWWQDR